MEETGNSTQAQVADSVTEALKSGSVPSHPDDSSYTTQQPGTEKEEQEQEQDTQSSQNQQQQQEQEQSEPQTKQESKQQDDSTTTTSSTDSSDPNVVREELERVKQEKTELQNQYSSLTAKLNHMRTAIAERLRNDADERDANLAQISNLENEKSALTSENSTLATTIDRLKEELVQAHTDLEFAQTERDRLQSRSLDSQSSLTELETEVRNLNEELERVKSEREDWQETAGRERVSRENLETAIHTLQVQRDTFKAEMETAQSKYEKEAQNNTNLQQILTEVQASKEKEMEDRINDLEAQVSQANASLEDYKQRATTAENKLSAQQVDSEKTVALQKEVKEKTLLIGKLRHEAVILNEHLSEALRRLRKDSAENNVDRRLVSNVLISFITTPRADAKRFEMLQLLASILSWSDEERERAGLQRPVDSQSRNKLNKSGGGGGSSSDDSSNAATENFSNLWIEFLLRESSQAQRRPSQQSTTSPSQSPSTGTTSLDKQPSFLRRRSSVSSNSNTNTNISNPLSPSNGSVPLDSKQRSSSQSNS